MMMTVTMATAMSLLMLQASVNAPRSAFGSCIKEATEKAKSEKIDPEAVGDYLRSACDPAGAKLKNALVAFDSKNGVSRARATEDAQMEIDDTFDSAARTFKRLYAETAEAQQ